MENKTIITCHGDQALFSKLQSLIVQGLPRDTVDWRRSYGRPVCNIRTEANFVPFNPDILPEDDDWSLLGRPFFHTYWTDCDIDAYKGSVKDDISDWLAILKSYDINDWLIIIVINDENKVKTKLLRTSVYDKAKSDFCSKQLDRKCGLLRIAVLAEPLRQDSKSAEAWTVLLGRLRQLLLQSYNRQLSLFEEHMRTQRECRNEPNWSFGSYFLLQEELAFMLEMLGVYEDALIQYDELDALFTQFVLNHHAGDKVSWMTTFTRRSRLTWDGVSLCAPIHIEKRLLIRRGHATLLDLRSYLFSRQCTLLFLLMKPADVAQRAIPFMHNCIQELHILDIQLPVGAVACWVFLSCLEVIRACDHSSPSGQQRLESHSLHYASLWNYARNKLGSLGQDVGLMPGCDNNPDQELITSLLEGATSHNGFQDGETEPIQKLQAALSSIDTFNKIYLELSELAMGTFKHIGRIRFAREIGRDLADFYLKIGEAAHAEGFLQDAYKMYRQQAWNQLADHTLISIATCQKLIEAQHRYVRSCIRLAGSPHLLPDVTQQYQEEFLKNAELLEDPVLCVPTSPLFTVTEIEPQSEVLTCGQEMTIVLQIYSKLTHPLTLNHISVALIPTFPQSQSPDDQSDSIPTGYEDSDNSILDNQTDDPLQSPVQSRRIRPPPAPSVSPDSFHSVEDSPHVSTAMLSLKQHFEMRPDNRTVASCGISHRAALQRVDSGTQVYHEEVVEKESYDYEVYAEAVLLKHGLNEVKLCGTVHDSGLYRLSQVCVCFHRVEFLESVAEHDVCVHVQKDTLQIELSAASSVFAGVPQPITLRARSVLSAIQPGTQLILRPSQGLTLSGPCLQPINTEEHMLELSADSDQQVQVISLKATAELPPDGRHTATHSVNISCDLLPEAQQKLLLFQHPFHITHKLHTCGQSKLVHVWVNGDSPHQCMVTHPTLNADSPDVEFIPLHRIDQQLAVNKSQCASYVWRLHLNSSSSTTLCLHFSIQCSLSQHSTDPADISPEPLSFTCPYDFTLDNYRTLYLVHSTVDMASKKALCVGDVSELTISIQATDAEPQHRHNIVYSVKVDNNLWQITGKTSGLIELSENDYKLAMSIIPLTAGNLRMPELSLQQQINGDVYNCDGDSDREGIVQLVSFAHGEVYNATREIQVPILPVPACGNSDITLLSSTA